MQLKIQFVVATLVLLIKFSDASSGDHSPFYQKCVAKCEIGNCTEDGKEFKEDTQAYINRITLWNCKQECQYDCMWQTVEAFHERNWRTPQFHGKWPFIRVLGMQEPASVIFSLLNAFIHFKMIKKFREKVRPTCPLVWLWHVYFIVCVHAWFWSAIFHYRDFLITEILDYACAFSIILMNCYLMSIRLLHDKVPKIVLSLVTVFFVFFFMSHAAYLSAGKIDYGYNMELNITVATFSALCWFSWCYYNRKRQKYVWKCAIYVALSGIVLLLELVDSPPYFFLIDHHSLWHLCTAPLVIFIF
ncbi:unnamed protein product [Phyllotreta striolata]|uniref:Post-GPI attachment to proteins factor 3 n=1 Tax=Phyllotreta striolata TaxID=444603 RepID=A0A9N9TPY6_PHYSR|nr:unnamed protein product [Phyllotreta striolata]